MGVVVLLVPVLRLDLVAAGISNNAPFSLGLSLTGLLDVLLTKHEAVPAVESLSLVSAWLEFRGG